ncbi:MAG: hypothetical protein HKM07_01380 [Chlamydiae bacterium]|jgi:hypothetical protein|nr:hypothetical protein [Chlamydiota bacterium]
MTKAKHKSSKYLLRGTSVHKAKPSGPKTALKKIKKEVRRAQKAPIEIIDNPLKKSSTTYKSKSYKPLPKKKWITKSQKFSHDTAKEEVLGTMNPQGIHAEGKRWIKTLDKQERLHSKELTHHYLKNRPTLKSRSTRKTPKK